jgi:MYXO-CTERM domain-containing protein
MRLFALIALALVLAAVPASAQSIGTGKTYVSDPNATPGEPPCAVLVMTGVAGIAFVRLRRRRSTE